MFYTISACLMYTQGFKIFLIDLRLEGTQPFVNQVSTCTRLKYFLDNTGLYNLKIINFHATHSPTTTTTLIYFNPE